MAGKVKKFLAIVLKSTKTYCYSADPRAFYFVFCTLLGQYHHNIHGNSAEIEGEGSTQVPIYASRQILLHIY